MYGSTDALPPRITSGGATVAVARCSGCRIRTSQRPGREALAFASKYPAVLVTLAFLPPVVEAFPGWKE